MKKLCSRCGERKSLDLFYCDSNPRNKTGRQSRCIECAKKGAQEYQHAHPDRKAASDKSYRERNPEKQRELYRKKVAAKPELYRALSAERQRRYRDRYREKIMARQATAKRLDRAANPEKYQKYEAEWRARNPERYAAITRKTYLKNRDKKIAAAKIWTLANRDKVLVTQRSAQGKRRQIKRRAAWPGEKEKIRLVYQKAKEFGFHVDHIVPLRHSKVCGLHVWANLQLLDRNLNGAKGNRTWPDQP